MNREKVRAELSEWADAFLKGSILAIVIGTFFIQAFKIPSGSMVPTLMIGDRIFVNKFLYSYRVPFINIKIPLPALKRPKRGDIIVFISPEDPKKDFVKRLIALGGESVEIKDEKIYIDGKPVEDVPSMRRVRYVNAGDYGTEEQVVTVPEDYYYVLGDNSANSKDSRFWGFVPKKNIIGKAMCVYWPLYRMKVAR